MPNRNQRLEKTDAVALEDTRPLVTHPLEGLDDRLTNPNDLEVDDAAIGHGMAHGGMQESRAETLKARGGRKQLSKRR